MALDFNFSYVMKVNRDRGRVKGNLRQSRSSTRNIESFIRIGHSRNSSRRKTGELKIKLYDELCLSLDVPVWVDSWERGIGALASVQGGSTLATPPTVPNINADANAPGGTAFITLPVMPEPASVVLAQSIGLLMMPAAEARAAWRKKHPRNEIERSGVSMILVGVDTLLGVELHSGGERSC